MVKGTITNGFDQLIEKFKGLTDDRGQCYILRNYASSVKYIVHLYISAKECEDTSITTPRNPYQDIIIDIY